MKKIFTLFALAVMAMSANAQIMRDLLLLENGKKYGDGDIITSFQSTFSVELGYDNKWKDVTLTSNGLSIDKDDKTLILGGLAEFAQIVQVKNSETGEMEDKARCVTLVGQNNPTDGGLDADNKYVKGVGYNPNNLNTPNNGTIYIFKPKSTGKMRVGIILNADKDFYVVKSDGTCLSQSEVVLYNQDGDVKPYANNDEHPYSVDEKIYGIAEFKAVANEVYTVFCAGSKLSFFGATFTIGGDVDGINEVKASNNANDAIYNLAGQQVAKTYKGVVIQSGKKFIQK